MEENGPYVEHIDSIEIIKLIDLLYLNKPENLIDKKNQTDCYEGIVQQIEQVMQEKSNKKYLIILIPFYIEETA